MKKLQLAVTPQVFGSLSSGIEGDPLGYCAPPCPCFGCYTCTYEPGCGFDISYI